MRAGEGQRVTHYWSQDKDKLWLRAVIQSLLFVLEIGSVSRRYVVSLNMAFLFYLLKCFLLIVDICSELFN